MEDGREAHAVTAVLAARHRCFCTRCCSRAFSGSFARRLRTSTRFVDRLRLVSCAFLHAAHRLGRAPAGLTPVSLLQSAQRIVFGRRPSLTPAPSPASPLFGDRLRCASCASLHVTHRTGSAPTDLTLTLLLQSAQRIALGRLDPLLVATACSKTATYISACANFSGGTTSPVFALRMVHRGLRKTRSPMFGTSRMSDAGALTAGLPVPHPRPRTAPRRSRASRPARP